MASEKIDALELDVNAKVTTENLDKLVTALGRLSKALDKVNAKQVNDGIKETGDSAKVAAEKANILTKSFADQAVKITALIALYRKLGNVISDGIENSMSYVENLNLFTVSMGEYAASAEKYGNTVKEALGIDPSNWIRTQGVFNTLIKGFGVGGDQAAYMSQNLTQLSYDIASFYNLSVAEAEQKLQSAVAGELEPVRRLGYDLSQSKLTEIAQDPRYYGRTTYAVNQETGALEANSEAINTNTQRTIANFNELTQGEKVQLRYIALMTQVTQAQGDMARTLNDPANQMRIFKEQLNQTSRALGNIFIPALNQVMPYITAFCQLMERAFNDIALFFGFELPDMSDRMDVGSSVGAYDDIADATGRAAKNAKKLKDYTLGIDELNVFRPDDKNNGGGGSGLGNYALGSLYKTPGYDFLGGAIENSIKRAREELELLGKDFKEHPLQVSWDILIGGAGELGANFWEGFLGMSPAEMQAAADRLGVDVKTAFFQAWARKGISVAFLLLGVDEDEAKANAEELGITLYEQLWIEAGKKAAKPTFETFISAKEFANDAGEAAKVIGEAFSIGFAKGVLKLFDNPAMKSFFDTLSGGAYSKGIKDVSNMLNGTTNRVSAGEYAKKGSYATGSGTIATSGANLALKAPSLGNAAADEARKQGEAYAKAYAEGLNSGAGAVRNAGNNLYVSGKNGADYNGQGGQMFYNTSANEAYKYAMGLTSPKSKAEVNLSGKTLAAQGTSGAKSLANDSNVGFNYAGRMSGQGYVAGVEKYKNSAKASGAVIAKAALSELQRVLGIHSPSTAYGEQAYWSVMGYANNMEKYSYLAEDAAKKMANASLGAVETANSYFEGGYGKTSTNAGYGIAAANESSMATLASQIYTAVVSGMSVVAETMNGGTKVIIDGKEVFRTVQRQERNSGIAIGNGAFV